MEARPRSSWSSGVLARRDDGASAGAQMLADPDQDGAEQRLLVGEVAVDGRPADADRGAEVLEAHAGEAALGEQARRLCRKAAWRSAFARSRPVTPLVISVNPR